MQETVNKFFLSLCHGKQGINIIDSGISSPSFATSLSGQQTVHLRQMQSVQPYTQAGKL